MIDVLIGNSLFALLVWGWYLYVQGNRKLTIAAALVVYASFLIGTVMGYRMNRKPRPKRRATGTLDPPVDPTVFDRIK